MHGLTLAGGEGARLAAGGIAVPKPLVEVAGKPQPLRLLETLDALGCDSLTCAIRADLADVSSLLDARRFLAPLKVMLCRTPSSLHTLAEALPGVPPGPVFCSMVDTVMRWRDWGEVYRQTEARLVEGADAVLAVTSFVDDESPVYVSRQAGGFVQKISDEPVAPYALRAESTVSGSKPAAPSPLRWVAVSSGCADFSRRSSPAEPGSPRSTWRASSISTALPICRSPTPG